MRATEHLNAVARDYPGVWQQYDGFLAGRKELGDWPSWCYCPMAAAYAVVTGGSDLPPQDALDVARVAALAAWRPTQGVYRFDPDLLEALWDTPLAGDLPTEHLQRLPEWCVYVELPRERGAHGFFAHLEYDAGDHRVELRLLLDLDDLLLPIALHLGGTIEGAVAGMLAEANRVAASRRAPVPAFGGVEQLRAIQGLSAPLVSVLLYLCAGEAELRPTRDPGRHGRRPTLQQGRSGPYMPAARRLEVWETGFTLGAALRDARTRTEPEGGGHSPRGHIRRAHWHSYWVGSGESRRLELRWLPPIAVNLDQAQAPTVRRVEDS